mmetsp:Transcript_22324/g.40102  ORF Transcript_22324/g.40102 Transcript_22324/m.40102 type:complete len:292 (-) Transcript_22324:441-1316(-)
MLFGRLDLFVNPQDGAPLGGHPIVSVVVGPVLLLQHAPVEAQPVGQRQPPPEHIAEVDVGEPVRNYLGHGPPRGVGDVGVPLDPQGPRGIGVVVEDKLGPRTGGTVGPRVVAPRVPCSFLQLQQPHFEECARAAISPEDGHRLDLDLDVPAAEAVALAVDPVHGLANEADLIFDAARQQQQCGAGQGQGVAHQLLQTPGRRDDGQQVVRSQQQLGVEEVHGAPQRVEVEVSRGGPEDVIRGTTDVTIQHLLVDPRQVCRDEGPRWGQTLDELCVAHGLVRSIVHHHFEPAR